MDKKKSNKTYVIPDLHGCEHLLAKFLRDHYDGKSKLVFLGDYVDRGPNSRGTIQLVRSLVDTTGAIALQGNHEQMMYESVLDEVSYTWVINGGDVTYKEYSVDHDLDRLKYDAKWLKTLPKYYEDEHRVYVHASVDPHEDLRYTSDQVLLWGRYGKMEDGGGYRGKHVVHGHTPARSVVLMPNRTCLDTGAVFYGTLAVGVFDDDTPGGPVDIIYVEKDEE